MTVEPRLTHAALQTRTAKVRAAAHDRDQARLRRELYGLVHAFAQHVAAESAGFSMPHDADAEAVRHGRARIVSTLAALARYSNTAAGYGECESFASELYELLERQDLLERKTLRRSTLSA
jgi:hypothetical protein